MKIEVTDKANKELKNYLKSKDLDKHSFRIYIAGFGWGGPTFGIALDEQKHGDKVQEIDELTFLVEEDLTDVYGSFTVDYSDSWLRKGFHVIPDVGGSTC